MHERDRGLSFAEYVRKCRADLSRRVAGLTRIYLDTNYWIWIRDARTGQPRCEEHRLLYQKLSELVHAGKAICPVVDNAVYEIFHQDSLESRVATAMVMDELSGGISLDSTDQRVSIEILHFFRTRQQGADSVQALSDWVWTHACWVLGESYPSCDGFASDIQTPLQVGFYDQMSRLGITGLVSCLASAPAPPWRGLLRQMAGRLNEGKLRHRHQVKSFKQAFMAEVEGILDVYRSEIVGALAHIRGTPHVTAAEIEAEIDSVTELFRTNSIGTALPSINILAGLHGLFRWNCSQRYKANDWFDHLHASAALPFFDFFLTEKALARVITSAPLKYDSLYNTRVCLDPVDALAALAVI